MKRCQVLMALNLLGSTSFCQTADSLRLTTATSATTTQWSVEMNACMRAQGPVAIDGLVSSLVPTRMSFVSSIRGTPLSQGPNAYLRNLPSNPTASFWDVHTVLKMPLPYSCYVCTIPVDPALPPSRQLIR
jgi:hypothetical protein